MPRRSYNGSIKTEPKYLCLTNSKGGKGLLAIDYPSSFVNIEYSLDTILWKQLPPREEIMLGLGESVYFRGTNPNIVGAHFGGEGVFECSGDVTTLLDPDGGVLDLSGRGTCFKGLFEGFPIVTAPELPSTILAEGCYVRMFKNTPIKDAPELPANELKDGCYEEMFAECGNLSHVKVGCTSYPKDFIPTELWLANVASSGVFECHKSAIFPSGDDGIPNGWTVSYY